MEEATARAIVESWEVVMVAQAWRRDIWRWPRVESVERRALEVGGGQLASYERGWRGWKEGREVVPFGRGDEGEGCWETIRRE